MSQTSSAMMPAEVMSVKQLPPLSTTAGELLEVVADPDVEVEVIAAIIERDPALTARILGLANSAYFGQSRPVMSVQEAIIRVLGLNLVKGLSMSIALAGSFDTSACPGLDMRDYWYRTLGTATLGRLIAQRVQPAYALDPDGIYLSGLLLRIGLLLLAHTLPQGLSAALHDQEASPEQDPLALERRHLGIDHVEAGGWLSRRWHLPELVCIIVAEQGREAYDNRFGAELCVVQGADRWLDARIGGDLIDLADIDCLRRVPGLDPDVLNTVERHFVKRLDELQTLARTLV